MTGIIYCITNTVNDKKYVGQTTRSLETRWRYHLKAVKNNSAFALHCAIRKYSAEAFKIEQVDVADSLDELNRKEAYYIILLETLVPGGYNIVAGGGGNFGYSHTVEARQKMSKESCNHKKANCPRGHPYDAVNTRTAFTGNRSCWTCHYLQNGRKLPERFQAYVGSISK